MSVINKPDMSGGIWSEAGNIVTPDPTKISQGHIVEKPKAEIVNWIENRQDKAIVYLFQRGIAEWGTNTTYPSTAYAVRSGRVYRAVVQNVDRDPLSYPAIWEVAFTSYAEYDSLLNEVNKIKNQDGYLNHYVRVKDPIMDATAKGVGYAFKSQPNKGLFLNGSNPRIVGGGNYEFTGTFTNANDVIRKSDLDAYIGDLLRYKVGDLYFTTTSTNPSQTLRYGTWVQYAQGRAIVGVSAVNSNLPQWTKYAGSEFGAYEHTLTLGQIPPHDHAITGSTGKNGTGHSQLMSANETTARTGKAGEGQPHNNVQPSVAVYIWLRTN